MSLAVLPVVSCLPAGTVLDGRYTIRRKIGEGAVASVYAADDTVLGGPVALKILDPLRGADPVGRGRFEREFAVLTRLQHPGVARCLRLVRDGGLDVLVLEYVEGESLDRRLARGRMAVDEALEMAQRIAEALEVCHAAGILHRDLKPSNIVLHPERGPIVLDFGAAWFAASANLTRTGAVLGSPQYMAPESFTSSLCDARADLYSLGAILFELLSGRPVRMASGLAEIALAHAREPPPSLLAIRPEVGAEIDGIVARAIAPRPEDRFATAAELAQALAGKSALHHVARTRTTCAGCRTPLLVGLLFCPGCGRDTSWEMRQGPYAVQIVGYADIDRFADWLARRRLGRAGTLSHTQRARLVRVPLPMAVGVSEEVAEQLLAEATEAGARAEMVRSRALRGQRLRDSPASAREVLAAGGLHLAAVLLLSGIAMLAGMKAPWALEWLPAIPFLAGLAGIAVAKRYARVPLLAHRRSSLPGGSAIADQAELRVALRSLSTERGRRLAATAIGRAAPVLLGQCETLPLEDRDAVLSRLRAAVAAATDLDRHAAFLQARSRSRLAVEIEQARAQCLRGEVGAAERKARLESERRDLVEASLAHDLAARQALSATGAITTLLGMQGA